MKRVYWLDILRVLSIFFVIAIHIVALNWYSGNPSTIGWNILNVYDSISRFCVPIFLMISGCLFLDKDKIDIKKLYSKNILRLIVALLFWNFIYALVLNPELFSNFSLKNIYNTILTFNNFRYHLWFILTLLGLYIITPLLKKITEDKKIFNYLWWLSIIIGIIIPTLNSFLELLVTLTNSPYLNIYYTLTNWLFKIDIPYVSGYLVFFLTGYKIYNESIKGKKLVYILGIISLIFTIVSTSIFSNLLKNPVHNFYNYNTINVYLYSIAIYMFFKDYISKINLNILFQRLINILSKCSFGIYLVHDIILIYLQRYNLYPLGLNNLLSIPIYTLIVYIISFIIIYLISKIPKINKYII